MKSTMRNVVIEPNQQTVLVTGGTGFVGKALCQKLVQAGYQVYVQSRKPESVSAICGDSVIGVGPFESIADEVTFDIIINSTGEPIADKRWTDEQKRVIVDSRYGTTSRIIDYINRAVKKPTLLINSSACGFYGDQGDAALDEESQGKACFTHEFTGKTEAKAFEAKTFGVRVAIVRTGIVLGLEGGMLQKTLPMFRKGMGGKMGNGRQWLPWIHIEDHVNLFMMIVKSSDLAGVFNGSAPYPVTNSEYTQKLANAVGRNARFGIPAWLLYLLMGERASVILRGQRVIPKQALVSGFQFRYPKIEQALGDLVA